MRPGDLNPSGHVYDMTTDPDRPPARRFRLSPQALRAAALQILVVAAVAALAWSLIDTARSNLADQHIASGFGFAATAGFDVSQSLIDYDRADSYGRVFLVGLANTLLVSALGIVFATALGFAVGIARLSPSWMLARLAGVYVEFARNLPLLFQILFWYMVVLGSLPGPRHSLEAPLGIFLNSRGLILPQPVAGDGLWWVAAAAGAAVLAAIVLLAWARARQARRGRRSLPAGRVALALVLGAPFATFLALGRPLALVPAELDGFNFTGGIRLVPELVALVAGLSFYTAGFVAEIVRAGIQSVDRGQSEAAASLGLRPGRTLHLVVIPQAMRVIVPPLTSQYLNVVKNSSLAMAIGFPDLVAVFAGTALNQTGQAIEIIAMTMAVYLAISLLTALAMNLYNRRLAPVGR